LYGHFINAVLSFVIIAAVVFFFVVVPLNALFERMQAKPTTPDPTSRKCPECLSEIPMAARRCAFCTAEVAPMGTMPV
jgi:large conductance mechanosensitive channel